MLTPELFNWDFFFFLDRSEDLLQNTAAISSLDTRYKKKGAASRICWTEDLWLWLP